MQTDFNPIVIVYLAEQHSNSGLILKRGRNFSWTRDRLDYIKFFYRIVDLLYCILQINTNVFQKLKKIFVNNSYMHKSGNKTIISWLFGLQSKLLARGGGNDI